MNENKKAATRITLPAALEWNSARIDQLATSDFAQSEIKGQLIRAARDQVNGLLLDDWLAIDVGGNGDRVT